MGGTVLPQDVWWLIAQELCACGDFPTLFHSAQTSRGLASLSLPLLYSIHEQSPAYNAHIVNIDASIRLWRSIIISSFGKTLYPYCCWLKILHLGSFHALLEDVARDFTRLQTLFAPPLRKLQIRLDEGAKGTRRRPVALNLDAIIVEAASKITECIKTAADEQDKAVGLTSLEGLYLPTSHLPNWVSSLSRLTSLSVRDGSVLNGDVGRAIKDNCPAFKELTCYFCQGTDVDSELAGFFRGLSPNTLESFSIISVNNIGTETFQALSGHALSLKRLSLQSLERVAFESMHHLDGCVGLESLVLEATVSARRYQWEADNKDSFQLVISWLQQCALLKRMDFCAVPGAPVILAEVLNAIDVALVDLNVEFVDEVPDVFYGSLSHQKALRTLRVRILNDDIIEAGENRHVVFAEAISNCVDLRELVTNELFTVEDYTKIATALPHLAQIAVNGDTVDDSFLVPFSSLAHLRSLRIFSPSQVTFDGVLRFLYELAAHPEAPASHEEMQLYFSRQDPDVLFTEKQEATLSETIGQLFRGVFEVRYYPDPDEQLDENSEFSD
ncbi:hypothetical protein B0H63DRAFT_70438 [Podospora didyma]|uniref:Uncharacterized protein n=1 Tax=Podospora didyma TaxID=330526 RepID=A0AAE0K170_9PEZI|nr:hypothetical protein B0H63DRAFT_70438 [Podospora didyma]